MFVFRKKMIDEDKRELRLYQEMYLADGDLHSEGSGRQRRFRWKNIGTKTFVLIVTVVICWELHVL